MDVNNVGTNDSGSAGWVIAIILLLLVIIGGYFAFGRTASTGTNSNADTSATVPAGDAGVGGSAEGSAVIDTSGGAGADGGDTSAGSGM